MGSVSGYGIHHTRLCLVGVDRVPKLKVKRQQIKVEAFYIAPNIIIFFFYGFRFLYFTAILLFHQTFLCAHAGSVVANHVSCAINRITNQSNQWCNQIAGKITGGQQGLVSFVECRCHRRSKQKSSTLKLCINVLTLYVTCDP